MSSGCFLRDSAIEHSIIGLRSRISGATVRDTLVMGADIDYTTDQRLCASWNGLDFESHVYVVDALFHKAVLLRGVGKKRLRVEITNDRLPVGREG